MALSKPKIGPQTASALLWALRAVVGAVFIVSGWAKCVDLQGFCLKIGEYLTALGWQLPQELVLMGATGAATLEFVTGVMLATGSLRRVAVWTAAGFMAVMLPLTLWIAVTDPVSDCGCFGDLIVLSNPATFIKNIAISAGIVLLWIYNTRRRGLYPPLIQWLVITVSWAYPLFIGYTGYQTQPLVDFRPFRTGSELFGENDDSDASCFVYERDGEERKFSLDALPDSTWTFVRSEAPEAETGSITVYSPDGEDVTDEVAEYVSDTPRVLVLVVSDPESQFMTRAHYLQELRDYLSEGGVGMLALVGASGQGFDRWQRLTRPNFPAYEAEDTALKMLVRGSAAVVYLRDGVIQWKSTLGFLSPELPYSRTRAGEVLDSIRPIDSGGPMWVCTALYLAAMLLLFGLGKSPKLLALLRKLCSRKKSLPV